VGTPTNSITGTDDNTTRERNEKEIRVEAKGIERGRQGVAEANVAG